MRAALDGDDILIVALGFAVLLHQGILFVAAPGAFFRYLYPTVLTCLVMTLLTLKSLRERQARAMVHGLGADIADG